MPRSIAVPHAVPAVLVLALAALPAPAGAVTTTVSFGGGGYQVRVTDENTFNNPNQINVSEDSAGNVLVTDLGISSNVVAGSNCSLQTADRVICPPDPSATATLEVTTGKDDDQIALSHVGKGASGIAVTRVFGGPGADVIVGGPAAETLGGDGLNGLGQPFTPSAANGSEGRDVVYGGGGPDTLLGHGDRDYLNGGAQIDTSPNTLDGGPGADFLDGGATLGPDRFTGGSGDDAPLSETSGILLGGVTLVNGEKAQVSGGDTVSYGTRTYSTAGTAGVVADLDGVADDGATGEGDQIDTDVEALVGSIRDDRLAGSSRVNRIEGRLGVDTLAGGDGADRMRFRDGVADRCFVPGTGDDVDLDLADPPATVCQPKSLPLSFTTTLNASPADETMPYVVIGRRARRRPGHDLGATVRCARSAARACTGTLAVARTLGGKALARRRFRARPGRRARVRLPLSAGEAARLDRAGRAVLTARSQGTSRIGPTTTTVARRF